MMKRIPVMLSSLLLGVCLSQASIISFDFAGSDPGLHSPWNTGTTTDPNLSTTGFTLGPGVVGNTGDDRFNAKSWSEGSSLSLAISGEDYFGFVITPNAGYALNLNSAEVAFKLQVSGTGPHDISLMSSVGGFSSGNELQNWTFTSGAHTSSFSYDFLSSGYDSISSPVEFRIYGFDASGSGGTLSANAFSVGGSVVPVPEPATWGVFSGFALFAILGVHVWRQNPVRRSAH